jgi:hypothetical protein
MMAPLFATDGTTFYFRLPWPPLALVLFLLFTLAITAVLYSRERSLPVGRRVLLALLRGALCLLIVVLLLEPVRATSHSVVVPGNVLILIDVSESMAIEDSRQTSVDLADAALALNKMNFDDKRVADTVRPEVEKVSRWAMAKGILEHPKLAFLRESNEKYRLRYFSFGEQLEAVPDEGESLRDWLAKTKPTSPSTRLGEAVQRAVERYSGQPISAVIVLTDGGSNGGVDPAEAARDARVPIFTVGLGLPAPEDLRLQTVIVADAVFPKDRVPVRVQLTATPGLRGKIVDLVVKNRTDGTILDRKKITLADKETQFEELSFVPQEKSGTLKLEVAVSELPGEASVDNNKQFREVTVLDKKIRVLYVEGSPHWEFRYLRAVLERDPRLDVKFLMTRGDEDLPRTSDRYIARFPEKEADAFLYDLVIIGDVPSGYFTPAQLEWLEKLVRERGGSFLMLAGHHYAPMSYLDTPVATLLPVKVLGGKDEIDADVHPSVTAAGLRSSMMALEAQDEETQARWSVVRPLYDMPRLDGAKAGATVLATLSDKAGRASYPLIAWQRVGTGKSLYVGTDQLWRLRYKHGDEYHARFWGQAIRFLTLSRLKGEDRRIRLETERTGFRAGERVPLFANVLDEDFRPASAETFMVQVDRVPPQGEARLIALKAAPGSPGLYEGFFTPEEAGSYRLSSRPSDQAHSNVVDFQVEKLNRERMDPAMQLGTLQEMAALSGFPTRDGASVKNRGRFLTVRDLPGLPNLLEDRSRTVALPPQEEELWNHWLVMSAVLLLAGSEWFLRRRMDLA